MPTMLIFGLGYTARRLADTLRAAGWQVIATRRAAHADALAFDDEAGVRAAIRRASHILSSVPPADGADPVLARYGDAIGGVSWLGYLSSTGVYGDAGGAWVDESAPAGGGRVAGRAEADAAWLAAGARAFRMPGIYGPGRSAIERVQSGRAHRVGAAGHAFSRVHVDDIVAGVIAACARGPAAAYNLADDTPATADAVVEEACRLLGTPPPPVVALDALSPTARGFHAESRRVANGRARRLLGWRPRFPDYRAGLPDCLARSATSSPASAAAPPSAAAGDQR